MYSTYDNLSFYPYEVFSLTKDSSPQWDYDKIIKKIEKVPLSQLKEKEIKKICLLGISDEDSEGSQSFSFKNLGSKEVIGFKVLVVSRKNNPSKINKIVKQKVEKEIRSISRKKTDWKPSNDWKNDLKEKIKEEEILKGRISERIYRVTLFLNERLVFTNSNNKSFIEDLEGILSFILGCPCETIGSFEKEFEDSKDKVSPFMFTQSYIDPPKGIQDFFQEFLTWLFIKTDWENKADDQKRNMALYNSVKIQFVGKDKTSGEMRSKNSNECISKFLYSHLSEDALVDEMAIRIKVDNSSLIKKDLDGFIGFVLKTGVCFKDIRAKECGPERDGVFEKICFICLEIFSQVMTLFKEFISKRLSFKDWSDNVSLFRNWCANYRCFSQG